MWGQYQHSAFLQATVSVRVAISTTEHTRHSHTETLPHSPVSLNVIPLLAEKIISFTRSHNDLS